MQDINKHNDGTLIVDRSRDVRAVAVVADRMHNRRRP